MKDSSPAAGEKEHRIYVAEIRGSSEKTIHGFFVNPPVMAEILRNFLNNMKDNNFDREERDDLRFGVAAVVCPLIPALRAEEADFAVIAQCFLRDPADGGELSDRIERFVGIQRITSMHRQIWF